MYLILFIVHTFLHYDAQDEEAKLVTKRLTSIQYETEDHQGLLNRKRKVKKNQLNFRQVGSSAEKYLIVMFLLGMNGNDGSYLREILR